MCLHRKRFAFQPLVPPIGAVRTEKTQFSGLQASGAQTSQTPCLTPTGRKGRLLAFWPVFGPGALREIPGPGRQQKIAISRCQGSRNGNKNVTTLSGMAVRNFLTFDILTDWSPTGRKSRNMGILGFLGPGRPSALRGIPGAG